MNKTDLLELALLQNDPHIAIITETWLREEFRDEDVFPPPCKVFRKDRFGGGGGVAVLIKSPIEAVLLGDVDDLECLCISLSCWGHRFILYALYRPPDAPLEYLVKLQAQMAQHNKNRLILAGDLNLPDVNWERLQDCSQNSKQGNILFDLMLSHDITQVVLQPTRVQDNCSSILDLVFIPRTYADTTTVGVEQGISDHFLVNVSIPIVPLRKHDKPPLGCFKDYSRANDVAIIEYIENAFINFCDDDVCTLWNSFKNMCHFCISNFIPNKFKRTSKQTPWMTRSIIHLKRKIKRLKKKHAPSYLISHVRDRISRELKSAKDYYFRTTLPDFIKHEPEKFWNYLSEKKTARVSAVS